MRCCKLLEVKIIRITIYVINKIRVNLLTDLTALNILYLY